MGYERAFFSNVQSRPRAVKFRKYVKTIDKRRPFSFVEQLSIETLNVFIIYNYLYIGV
jgi:hypothetical protein